MLQALEPAASPGRIEPQGLNDALARLACGVALIACWDGGSPSGLIATSLSGLSVDPPRVMFSVRHEASAHDALLREGRYTATILSEAEVAEAHAFAANGSIERFAPAKWRLDDAFAPRLRGGLSSFDLRTDRWIRASAATIFIAEVLAVDSAPGSPLLYFERGFAAIGLAPTRAPRST
ncbi:MAG: flavin reductase family protein [Phenylobacterium sp.]